MLGGLGEHLIVGDSVHFSLGDVLSLHDQLLPNRRFQPTNQKVLLEIDRFEFRFPFLLSTEWKGYHLTAYRVRSLFCQHMVVVDLAREVCGIVLCFELEILKDFVLLFLDKFVLNV